MGGLATVDSVHGGSGGGGDAPRSGDLDAGAARRSAAGGARRRRGGGQLLSETHEAALELNTRPHATVGSAIAELGRLRARLARDAQAIGLATAAAGMHPGEMIEDPQVSPAGRYQVVQRTMRGIARR